MSVTPWWWTGGVELDRQAEEITRAIDQMATEVELTGADGPCLVGLERALAQLEALVATAAVSFESGGEWALDGAQTAAAWVGTECRLPRSVARRQVRRGRVLSRSHVLKGAFLDGAVTSSHVDALGDAMRRVPDDIVERDEEMLVELATTLTFPAFVAALAYWEQMADPDGCEAAAEARRARRQVSLDQSFNQTWLGSMTFDPLSGDIVAGELARLEHELFVAEWAEAKERLGRDPTEADLPRRSGQRKADAMVEMAIRSKGAAVGAHRPEPLFTVLIDGPTLFGRTCELASGTIVTPGSLLPFLERADVERAVFEADKRVEVSATARFYTGAIRRAIEVRDRECTHPYCDRRAKDCQVDHIIPYAQGGRTTQENGRLLCGFHNRLRNREPAADSESA